MRDQQTIIKCTICHSSNAEEMLSLSAAKIMICANCKNAFTYPKPILPDYTSEDFQARNGATESLTSIEDLPEEIKDSYNLQLAMIEKNLPHGSSVLEIGGGEGIFLEMVRKKGYEVDLIEPSVSASRRARKRGLNVYNDYVQNIKFDKKYALICMSHVLEHIDDPVDAINKIKNLLTPDGLILLAQTNFKGFMPSFLKANWYAWVPDQHFTHFSLAGLEYVAAKSSFSVLTYKYSRLVHGPSVYHKTIKYIPFLQDQIHVMLKLNRTDLN